MTKVTQPSRVGRKIRGDAVLRADLPPGPAAPSAVQGLAFWTRPLAMLERCRARYGTPFTLRIPLAPPFVMLADPGQVEEVFRAPPDVLHPGEGARVLEPIVGSNSVILLDGDAHVEQRRLLLGAFHRDRMARLADQVAEVAERRVLEWPRDAPVPLHPLLQDLTLEVILAAVFGLRPGARMSALKERLGAMLAFGDRPVSMLPPRPDSLAARVLQRTGPFVRFLRLQEEADAMLLELLAERRRDGGEGDDVLAMLLAARHVDGSEMTDQELRDELLTLLVAGHETTASTLAWVFHVLAREPAVLARLRNEIRGGEREEYLTAAVQETLRRRPVLPNAAPRLVKRPIAVGGREYPPGVCLVPNGYLLHHDAALYPDPYAFRPERFLERPPGTYTWIPFGGGRRRCLGAGFAMLEMRTVLKAVLGSRELRADGAVEVARRRNITIRPSRGARTVLA